MLKKETTFLYCITFSIFSATNIFAFSAMTPAASAAYVCAYDDGILMMKISVKYIEN